MPHIKNDFTRNNNFNLLRIYLSLSVVFYHCYELSQKAALNFVNTWFNGERAVEAFFIISGYLIIKSYYRCASISEFLKKRILRIYPAYFVVIVLCVIAGAVFTTLPAAAYFTSAQLYKYIAVNVVFLNFLQPTLPGVFSNNFLSTVNGSLWTLKIEVAYYFLVPLIAVLRTKINVHLLYGLIFISSLIYFLGMKQLFSNTNNQMYLFLSRQITGQLFYFIAGAWLAELEKKSWFITIAKWAGIPCIIAIFFPFPISVECVLLAIAVYFCACIAPSINFRYKQHDISYGLYIYHFPVIQVLVSCGLYNSSVFLGFTYSVIITFLLAVFSWFFVERPFITKKKTEILIVQ